MAGPLPKDPALRQRRNRAATSAMLDGQGARTRRVPGLPKRVDVEGKPLTDAQGQPLKWHPMTRSWWRDVWRSPMAEQFLAADAHALFRLAVLVDAFWQGPTQALAAEIRLQQQAFGLTPIDRRRLQWEMEAEGAEGSAGRAQPRRESAPPQPIEDPRALLRVVGG